MYRDFIIKKIVRESNTIKSFYLVPKSGKEASSYLPGQFISVLVSVDSQEQPIARNYTLSDRPGLGYYRITVKKETSGLVSTHLFNKVGVGDTIKVSNPMGNFFLNLNSDDPVLLLSGGVGITPMMSMLEYLAATQNNRKVFFLHSSTNKEVQPMAKRIHEIKFQNPNYFINIHHTRPLGSETKGNEYDNEGVITLEFLKKNIDPQNLTCYLCGPYQFMDSMFRHLIDLGVPSSNINYEFFGDTKKIGPSKNKIDENIPSYKVLFSKSNITALWKQDTRTILELAESLGIAVQNNCRMGTCATCETQLLNGTINYNPEPFIEAQEGHIYICCSQPVSDIDLYL